MAKYRVLVSRTRVIRESVVVYVAASNDDWARKTAKDMSRGSDAWTPDCYPADTYDIEHVKEIAQ